ncbi:SfiI-subtelomeric fragment related protein family member, putative [Theileria annulata]|uniref:SfiI-subtelomeric related protein family member, putative n=1 Tax=Theileria annulata TaxID=5874 RepID=Q4UFD6_THEAN|nr:SfiI-subtelomeric fragment related protein family member, putative [Theileria annulata]CAI74180.1 SfiI-subtelomeric fragment related protein family member, putative [Theileria annulata]
MSNRLTGTGTSAGQASKSSKPESQPKSSSSATDQSSSGTGETQEGQSTTPVSEVISPTVAKQTETIKSTEDASAKASVTVISPTNRPRPKKTPEVATGHRTAITLNIGEKASNSAIDFKEDYQKNVTVFSAKEKYAFNKIVKIDKSETVIWEAKNETEYFHKVYVDGLGTFSKTKNMSLHLCNGTFKHLNGSDSGPWSESPAVVDLDVRISNSNIQVDYFQKDNYRIYVAKPGYTIRKVMKSKKCSSDCCCSGLVIWEADKEHALKVVLMGSKKEPKHLAVLMKSGELTLLFKSGKGEPWEDITSSKNNITDLKMYAMAEGESVELHKGHYSITLFNEFYGYLFYEGVGCVKVTHNGKNIWDLREERDFGCLKGVFLDLKSNKFNVMNDNDRCWVCEKVRKVNPVTLDVSSKASTDDFDFTVDHNRNINVYTSKGNAMFYQVVKRGGTICCGSRCCGSETVIWETEDPQRYASKVFADIDRENVSIYLLNGDILHFSEGGRNKPWKKSDNKIILDVSKTSSTIGYDFVHHGETRTFTTKPGYQFKTVMLSSSWTWLVCGSSCCKSGCLSDDIFWESEKDDEWSNMVTVYGVESSVKNINIFLNNNKVKHFHKMVLWWSCETSIVLNIDVNTDNSLFEYRSTRNFGHFNPKANLTITMIVKSTLKIWTAKPEDHGLKAVLMGSGKDEKFLSILLQSGNFVLLWKSGQGQPWKDITQEKSDFSGINMYSLEEGTSNYHELTNTDYDPIIFESRYGYEFKEGVKCVKITYNDKPMWNHTEDAEFGYLKGLYLDLPKDQFSVTNLKDQTKELIKPITTVSLDIDKKESTDQYYYLKDGDCEKYSAKSGYVFNKIVDGIKDIWKTTDGIYGTLVRTKSKDDGKYLAILMTNNMFKLLKEEDNKWKDITSQRSDITKLTFLGDKDTKLKASDYMVTIVDYSYQFMFKGAVSCKKIMYGDDEVWKPSDDKNFSEIRKFQLGLISNSFFVINNKSELKKLEFKPSSVTEAVITQVSVAKPAVITVTLDINATQSTNEFDFADHNGVVTFTPKDNHLFSKVSQGTTDIWESKTDVNGTLVRTKVSKDIKYLVVLMTNNMFTLFNLEGGEWKDITSKRHDVTMLKFLGEGDTELSKTDYTVSIVDLSFTYIFNAGIKCKKIKLGEEEVWKHSDDSNFADIKSFSLGLASNSFFVKNQSDEVKKIEEKAETETPEAKAPEAKVPEAEEPEAKAPKDEAETPATTPEAKTAAPVTTPEEKTTVTYVTLDISKTQSTDEFDFNDESGIVTYSTKSGNVFSKVSHGTKVVWKSKNNICSTLVRSKTKDNVKYLVVLLTNNMFKLFHEFDVKWTDITYKRHNVTKLKFLGDKDTELKSSDYTVSIVDLSYQFKFNTGVKCKKITYNNNPIWTHTDDSNFSEIKSLSLDLPKNMFFVTNYSDQNKELDIKVTLDIENTKSTSQFDYSDHNGIVTYSVKSDHVFNKVSQGSRSIWEYKDLYGRLVRTKLFSNNERFLAIIFYNNTFNLFRQSEEDKTWEDITNTRRDVTKLKFLSHNDHEIAKTDYTVTIVDFFYRFKFKYVVKCVKITYNNKILWNHTDDPNYSDITTFYLGIISNRFFVKSMYGPFKKLPETTQQQPESTEESTEAEEPDETSEAGEAAESKHPEVPNSSEQSTPLTSSASSS